MNCSPRCEGENRIKNPTNCTDECIYYKKCLEELGLPEDHKTPKWFERLATTSEISRGKFHLKKIGKRVVKVIWDSKS